MAVFVRMFGGILLAVVMVMVGARTVFVAVFMGVVVAMLRLLLVCLTADVHIANVKAAAAFSTHIIVPVSSGTGILPVNFSHSSRITAPIPPRQYPTPARVSARRWDRGNGDTR